MMRHARLILALIAILGLTLFVRYWPGDQALDIDEPETQMRTDALEFSYEPLSPELLSTTTSLGLLLIGSWMFGRLFALVGLPKLSGYLIFGVLVGPAILDIVTLQQLPYLKLVESIAIALIALTAGGEIELRYLKRALKLILSVVILQVSMTAAAVTTLVYTIIPYLNMGIEDDPRTRLMVAFIVGTIATAASPAVVIAVINEVRAKGPIVQPSLSIVVFKDLALVILFTIMMAVVGGILAGQNDRAPETNDAPSAHVEHAEEGENSDAPPGGQDDAVDPLDDPGETFMNLTRDLGLHLIGSVIVGIFVGLGFSWYMHYINDHVAIFVVLGCFGIALISEALHLESLLVALVAGVLMRNVWEERMATFFHTIEDLSLPVYCVFFAVAGAKLDLDALLDLWPAAVSIACTTGAMVWISTHIACRILDAAPAVRRWLWSAFIPQAGISVALVSVVQSTFSEQPYINALYSLLLATITIHELVGPVLFKLGLIRTEGADEDQQEADDRDTA